MVRCAIRQGQGCARKRSMSSKMFIDARKLPQDSCLSADLAIIGAGPAGITLARSMIGGPTRVCLLEAGGTALDGPTQALYEGKNVGIECPLAGSRLRYFGGSSNHWGGLCRTLHRIDLERRDWLPDSGWPFAFDELQRYYDAASAIVEVSPARFSDRVYWQEKTGEHLREMPSGRMDLAFIQFSPPTRFGQRYGEELKAAPNIDVLLNANVTNIGANQDGQSVQRLDIATLNGLRHRVDAKAFVLATGGLENPRLLLLSNAVLPAGLGNQHDLVGRYFMEHPHLSDFGEVVVPAIDRLPKVYWRSLPVPTPMATPARGLTIDPVSPPERPSQRLSKHPCRLGPAHRHIALSATQGHDRPCAGSCLRQRVAQSRSAASSGRACTTQRRRVSRRFGGAVRACWPRPRVDSFRARRSRPERKTPA